ncbi:MAG: TetR family transcriptional regulator, partial [Dokdonella sp.]|nr:TetR family transcriptional regulator [Dokdonella sp.]
MNSPALPPRDNTAPVHERRKVDLARRGEERAEMFLQSAIEVFLEKGYRQTRLSDIVARAGGSYATL